MIKKNSGGRPRKLTDEQKKEIVDLAKKRSMKAWMIAKRFGVSDRTVERVLKEARDQEKKDSSTDSLEELISAFVRVYNYYVLHKDKCNIEKVLFTLRQIEKMIVKRVLQEGGYELKADAKLNVKQWVKCQ